MVRADRYRKLPRRRHAPGRHPRRGRHPRLDHHVERLADDHANARRLAEGIAAGSRLDTDPAAVPTNIVLAACTRAGDTAEGVCDELAAVGVMAAPYDRTRIRFVTSLEVDAAGVEAALEAASRVIG